MFANFKHRLQEIDAAQFARFVIVGIINTAVFFSVASLLILQFQQSQLIAYSLGFVAANIVSFVLHGRFSFRARLGVNPYAKFLTVSVLSLTLVAALGHLGDRFDIDYRITFLATLIIQPIITFAALKFWVFRPGEDQT